MLASTARTLRDGDLQYTKGIMRLEGVDGRIARVGHVDLYGRSSRANGRGACSSRDGLIIGEGALTDRIVTADGHIVHRSLAGSGNAVEGERSEGAQERIHDPLGSLDISGGDGSREAGIDNGSLRCDHCDRRKAAFVSWDL